ncbi:MAG: signal peptidase II [Clostridia bacterium]|nr:signal peptidase II [Clostridia bacterium]
MLFTAGAVAALDQLIKRMIERFPIGETVFSAEPVFEIVHTLNQGAAFSMFSGRAVFLIAVTTIMLIALAAALFFYCDLSGAARWAMAFLLGGGIGNWLDRVWCGSVTDYIHLCFIRFPVFNFSDICITLSVLCLLALLLTNRFEVTGESHGRGY